MRRIVLMALILSVFMVPLPIYGQRFQIKTKSVNFGSPATKNLTPLSTRLDSKQESQFNKQGFVYIPGYSYINDLKPLMFQVENVSLDLGNLTSGAVKTATSNIAVTASAGFAIKTNQNGRLSSIEGETTIPDTSCNSGKESCSESASALWTKHNTAGFGYRFDSSFASSDFKNALYFRRFPDKKAREKSSTIMHSLASQDASEKSTHRYTGLLKIKAVAFEKKGEISYSTIIDLVALPSF